MNALDLTVPGVFAITVHEIAHGWVAKRCGDTTAADEGRLTLNPIKHIDSIGTVLVPGLFFLAAHFLNAQALFFGWAKPVPVEIENLRRPARDQALVAAAGPAANLLMLLGWWGAFHLILKTGIGTGLLSMCFVGIMFNITIMLINLFPIPPLDGSRVIAALLPGKAVDIVERMEFVGIAAIALLLLDAMFFSNLLGKLLSPVFELALHLI